MFNDLLFSLRRIWLRFSSFYPKHLFEDEMLKKGKTIWETFYPNGNPKATDETLSQFQKMALKLNGGDLFCLQIYLEKKTEDLSVSYDEFESCSEEKTRLSMLDELSTYLASIS